MADDERTVYVGCGAWSGETGKIQVLALAAGSGKLRLVQELPAGGVAAYMVLSPAGDRLYVADETQARISRYDVADADGRLSLSGEISTSGHPVYLALHRDGRSLVTCYFQEARTEVFAIAEDGSLGESTCVRDSGKESHCTVFDPSGRFLYVPTRGDDWVSQYRFEASRGQLMALDPPQAIEDAGSGPRHLVFHPRGRFAYLVGEHSLSLSVYSQDAETGQLARVQSGVPMAPSGIRGGSAADVRVHPSGRYLYASNRQGDDSTLAIFAIDEATGGLSLVGHESTRGRTPRNFALDRSGETLIVGNRESDALSVFAVGDGGASLEFLGSTPVPPGPFFVGFR